MNEPRTGQHVITEHGLGTVAGITAGHADADISRYLITTGTEHRFLYLDEIIVVPETSSVGAP